MLLVSMLLACGATPNPKRPDESSLWSVPEATAPQTTPPKKAAAEPLTASAPTSAAHDANAGAQSSSAGSQSPSTGSQSSSAGSQSSSASSPNSNAAVQSSTTAAASNAVAATSSASSPAASAVVPASTATSANPMSALPAAMALEPRASSAQDADDLVVANVAGKTIGVRELLGQWVHQNSMEALDQLDHLVLTRLVQEEGRRLGVRVDAEKAERAYSDAVTEIEKKIAEKKPGVSLDQWVDQMLGLDPLVYRNQLRADALNQLLAERVTRAFMLESERAEMRVIVVKSEDKLKEAQAALAAGEAFADVARRLSSDPSSKDGGRVPAVIRSETVMGHLAFQTKVGEVGGPQYSQGAWLLVKVEALPQPIVGTWAEISPAVEQSLSERRIEELEFSQWKSVMMRRYPVDVSPFLRAAGQPVK
jgi:parvulin-like peptidyl-prolyl isomerase